jgi:aryl-alcohol dehydrogenase-like predicted oxidoreductase
VWSPLAGGWLSGRYRKGIEIEESLRARRIPQRYDLSMPENQRKLDVADQLAQVADGCGIPLVHLAIAFVLEHPAVTSAIIGPRTMDQLTSQLDAADIHLAPEVLDAIDKIVPPGTNLNDADGGYQPPSITSAWRRRRGAR